MKKIFYVILGIVLLGTSGCLSLTASMKKSLAKIENKDIDMETVEDGIFEGHSELAPVKVDVCGGILFSIIKLPFNWR